MSTKSLFKIEYNYAVIQSKICGANVLKKAKNTTIILLFPEDVFKAYPPALY